MSGQPGQTKLKPMHAGQARHRIWQSMRILRRFTLADLIASAESTRTNTQKYVQQLRAKGYVRVIQARRSGFPGEDAVYQLVRNTGPLPPRIGKQGLHDPNIEPTTPEPGDRLVQIRQRDYDRAMLCVRACAGLSDEEIRVRAGV